MNYETLGIVTACIITILGGIATLLKVMSNMRKERQEENDRVLKEAKDYTDSKIKLVQEKQDHQKEIYEGKISELTTKIEELKEEMQKEYGRLHEEIHRQHSQIVDLLKNSLIKK